MKSWELLSIRLKDDGAEALILRDGNGRVVREYAPGKQEYQNVWTCYSNGFPLKEFSSREAVVKDANRQALPADLVYRPHRETEHEC